MKRYRRWMILFIFIVFCAGGAWLTLQVTAEYPGLGEPVSYPVNQVDGFALTIEKPSWSPWKGYTIRWTVAADSEEVYSFTTDGAGFTYFERRLDGQWYRLKCERDAFFNSLDFPLGGEAGTSLQGSIVQKYDGYGTRLEAGTYRLVLEMSAKDGTPHYLAAEFEVG